MSDETTPEAPAVPETPRSRLTLGTACATASSAPTGAAASPDPERHRTARRHRRGRVANRAAVQCTDGRPIRPPRTEAAPPPRLAWWPQPPQARHRHRRRTGGAERRRLDERRPTATTTADGDDELDDDELGHDYTDAAADRGMTTDDVAEVALEEAGSTHAARGRARPATAGRRRERRRRRREAPDRRHPPRARAAAAERRRRQRRRRRRIGRAGDGTARPSGGVAAVAAVAAAVAPVAPAAAPAPVAAPPGRRWRRAQQQPQPRDRTTSCAPTSASVTSPRPSSTTSPGAAPRPHPQGPPGRALPDVRARRSTAATPRSACSRAAAWSSTTLATPDDGNESIDGNIYLGRVQNVLPGMEAAFIDIGTPKNGVLYRGDVAFDKADLEGGGKPKIERVLKNGQIDHSCRSPRTRSAHKGARLTQEVSLAGRFLVMVPNQPDDLRHLEAPARRRAQAAAQGARRHPPERRRPHRAHRGRGRHQRRARARRAPAAGPVGADLGARRRRRSRRSCSTRSPTSCCAVIREEFTKEYRGDRHRRPRALRGDPKATSRRSRPSSPTGSSTTTPRTRACRSSSGSTSHEQLHEGARPQGVAAVGRLAHHRAHRGAHRDRRQHRQERRQVEPRGDRLPEQPRGGRGGRPPAPAARHRRDHRHRLHRHGDQARTATR